MYSFAAPTIPLSLRLAIELNYRVEYKIIHYAERDRDGRISLRRVRPHYSARELLDAVGPMLPAYRNGLLTYVALNQGGSR